MDIKTALKNANKRTTLNIPNDKLTDTSDFRPYIDDEFSISDKNPLEHSNKPLTPPLNIVSNSLANEDNSLANENNSLANENNSLANEDNSLANENNSLANEDNSLANEDNSLANEDNSLANEDNSLANEDNFISNSLANENNSLANENNSLANENNSLANENNSLANENNSLANENNSLANENNSLANENNSLANVANLVSRPLENKQGLCRKKINNFGENKKKHLHETFSKKELELMHFILQFPSEKDVLISEPMPSLLIINSLKISNVRLRNIIFRVAKKKGVRVINYKRGKHAVRVFKFEYRVYKYLMNSSLEKPPISLAKVAPSISININKTTTTKTKELDINIATELSEDWSEINIEPLAAVGFSISNLKQLCKKSLNTPDVVQESIHHFAYSLKHNDKVKAYSHPLNVLMGVLRKGEAWVESRYESPQLIAQRAMLKRKVVEQEEIKKLREAAFNLAFEAWQDGLSNELQTTLLKETKQGKHDIRPEKIRLIKYFTETIWPDKKSEYLTDQAS